MNDILVKGEGWLGGEMGRALRRTNGRPHLVPPPPASRRERILDVLLFPVHVAIILTRAVANRFGWKLPGDARKERKAERERRSCSGRVAAGGSARDRLVPGSRRKRQAAGRRRAVRWRRCGNRAGRKRDRPPRRRRETGHPGGRVRSQSEQALAGPTNAASTSGGRSPGEPVGVHQSEIPRPDGRHIPEVAADRSHAGRAPGEDRI